MKTVGMLVNGKIAQEKKPKATKTKANEAKAEAKDSKPDTKTKANEAKAEAVEN